MIQFEQMVAGLKKDGNQIQESLTPQKCDLLHMTMGLSGESGEFLDAVKKHIMYNKPLDMENVIEELGDIEFFLEGIRQNLNILREDTIAANIAKLGVRYQGFSYSDKAAQERADKRGEQND